LTPRRREGPIFNHSRKSFYADFYCGFPPRQTRVRKSLRTSDPKKARWLYDQEYKRAWEKYYGVKSGLPVSPAVFADLIPHFVVYERDVAKAVSWKTFEQRLAHVSAALGPDITVNEIGHGQVRKLEDYLYKMKRPRSKATVNHYVGLLKTFFNWAIREGFYQFENPMKQVKAYPIDRKRREYPGPELTKIIDAARKIERDAPPAATVQRYAHRIVMLLLLTGMRLGELLGLKWDNVRDDAIVLERTETKQRREKIIPITPGVKAILDGLKKNGNGHVFQIPDRGKRVEVRRLIQKIRELTGIQGFVLHGLRHTAASIMVSEALGRGAGLDDVMRVLGHSRIETTLRYDHSAMARMRLAMQALEDKIPK